jgi:hypothetical protein
MKTKLTMKKTQRWRWWKIMNFSFASKQSLLNYHYYLKLWYIFFFSHHNARFHFTNKIKTSYTFELYFKMQWQCWIPCGPDFAVKLWFSLVNHVQVHVITYSH